MDLADALAHGQGALAVGGGLFDPAQAVLQRREIVQVGQHLGEIAAPFAAGDRTLKRLRAAAALVRRLQHVGEVGPVAKRGVAGRVVGQAGGIGFEQRDGLGGALGLRQRNGDEAHRHALASQVARSERKFARLNGSRHRLGVAHRHQQGLRAGQLGLEPLRFGGRLREQSVGQRLRLFDALDQQQHLERFAAGAKGLGDFAGCVPCGTGRAAVHQLFAAARRGQRLPRSRLEGPRCLGPALRCLPVRRHPRIGHAAARQLGGDLAVQQLGDRLRHRGARCVEHEVVRERGATHDVGFRQFAPRVGQVERVRAQHGGRQLEVEVAAGERREARQAQRRRAQQGQPLFDQPRQWRRRRQSRRGGRVARLAAQPCAQGFKQEQRVAAAVAPQAFGPVRGGQARKLE